MQSEDGHLYLCSFGHSHAKKEINFGGGTDEGSDEDMPPPAEPITHVLSCGHDCLTKLERTQLLSKACQAARGFSEQGDVQSLRAVHIEFGSVIWAGADQDKFHPAHWAAERGHAHVLSLIAELGGVHSFRKLTTLGRTPGWLAARQGSVPCMKVIGDLGYADTLSIPDRDGCMPSWICGAMGQQDVLDCLLEFGQEKQFLFERWANLHSCIGCERRISCARLASDSRSSSTVRALPASTCLRGFTLQTC